MRVFMCLCECLCLHVCVYVYEDTKERNDELTSSMFVK